MAQADFKPPTRAQLFRDAVWEAGPDELTPIEALALLAYADHARGGDSAWVAQARLIQRCKLGSKGTPTRVLAALVDKGWLELLSPAQWRNKQSPTYRLVIPTAPSDGEMKPPRSKRKPPRSNGEPPRLVAESSPSDGAKLPVSEYPLSSEGPSRPSGEGEPPRAPEARGGPPEEQDPPPLPPGEGRALALAAAAAARKRDVVISHWKQPPPAIPNPAYNPARAAVATAELPVFDFPRRDHEDGDQP